MGATGDAIGPLCWSTEEVEQHRALSYWVDTVSHRFLALDIDSPLRNHFHARLEQIDLGPTTINSIQAETQRVRRTHANLARSPHPVFILLQLQAGQVKFRQLGREAIVRSGESVFIDGTEPYFLECPQSTRSLALRMPEPWLKQWVPHAERFAARVFAGRGWSAALNAALGALEIRDIRNELALPRDTVAEQIAALLALAVGPEGTTAPGSARLFDELVRTLRNRLHEENLSPQRVAEQHRISKRTLHYAFARANTTFIEQLMRLRLERAREILSDARFVDLPVSEVGARCGFMDPSHFARRFRQVFGERPLQFRSKATLRARH
jgi:AraC family transcriptional regulator, positive regulator of tynA and feaB